MRPATKQHAGSEFGPPPVRFDAADAILYPRALADGNRIFRSLADGLDWEQEVISLFGRRVLQPRLSAWCGDAAYTYSGLTLAPAPWHPVLADLRDRCSALTGVSFNTVLANLYRDGRDSMGWHSDDEKSLGPEPVIASVNLGGARRFQLRRKTDKTDRIEMDLGDGDILIMRDRCQHDWQHQVPKTSRPVAPRINLTFRHVFYTLSPETS